MPDIKSEFNKFVKHSTVERTQNLDTGKHGFKAAQSQAGDNTQLGSRTELDSPEVSMHRTATAQKHFITLRSYCNNFR